MKTLYESILDDEDVLISNVKDIVNDPFATMIAAVDSNMTEYEFAEFIGRGIFDKFIKEDLYLNPEDFYWQITSFSNYMVSIILCSDDIDIDPLVIRYKRKTQIVQILIHKYNNYGRIQKVFEYDKYKKILSNIGKRGFKKSNSSLDKIGNYNAYNKKI